MRFPCVCGAGYETAVEFSDHVHAGCTGKPERRELTAEVLRELGREVGRELFPPGQPPLIKGKFNRRMSLSKLRREKLAVRINEFFNGEQR